jgi:hypothetical protein
VRVAGEPVVSRPADAAEPRRCRARQGGARRAAALCARLGVAPARRIPTDVLDRCEHKGLVSTEQADTLRQDLAACVEADTSPPGVSRGGSGLALDRVVTYLGGVLVLVDRPPVAPRLILPGGGSTTRRARLLAIGQLRTVNRP